MDIAVCMRIYDSRASAVHPYTSSCMSTSLIEKFKLKTDKSHLWLGERRVHTKLAPIDVCTTPSLGLAGMLREQTRKGTPKGMIIPQREMCYVSLCHFGSP